MCDVGQRGRRWFCESMDKLSAVAGRSQCMSTDAGSAGEHRAWGSWEFFFCPVLFS